MEVLVSTLSKRRSGSIASRDHTVPCEVVRFGRGTDNEVQLPDPRIPIDQATLRKGADGLRFESYGATRVQIDGKDTKAGKVKIGSVIELGPYEVKINPPPEGIDVAISVELVHPLGDGLDRLKSRSVTALADTWLNVRALSWTLFLVILGLFLVWPIADYMIRAPYKKPIQVLSSSPITVARTKQRIWPIAADKAWDTGEISSPHKFIGNNCDTCHRRAFEQVTDAACVACHPKTEQHADITKYRIPELTDLKCQACHKEHMGRAHIVRQDQDFCVGCHVTVKNLPKDSKLREARDFGAAHPEFRPLVMVDPVAKKRERIVLNQANWPVERSNLNFTHKKHMDPKGIRLPTEAGRRVLKCEQCHKLESNGADMLPIKMETQCAECHRLQFEPKRPERVVPHGSAEKAIATIQDFYRAQALAGGVVRADAPPIVRRRPGTVLTEPQRKEAMAWADDMTRQATEFVFTKAVCKTCHTVTRESGNAWRIAPVAMTNRWMPVGPFNHRAHATTECAVCHAATESKASTDVLLPQIAVCQTCHGGQKAKTVVPSTCVMCHKFHQPGRGPMRPDLVKATAAKS